MRKVVLIVIAVFLLASLVGAQDINIGGQTKIFGNMDMPQQHAWNEAPIVVSRRALYFAGWALSCHTSQQPTDVALTYLGAPDPQTGVRPMVTLRGNNLLIRWRLRRPDVTAYMRRYCNLWGDAWGYYVAPLVEIPLGKNTFALAFLDPSVGVGINIQQVEVIVVE